MSEIDKNEPTLLENIRSGYDTFSKGQKRIAGYILDNYVSAAYMTAARLSKETGVSESTVVRFATELGYEGYPEMQSALQGMLKNRLTPVQRINLAAERIGDDILGATLRADIAHLKATLAQTDRDNFAAIVDMLLYAKTIYIVGNRSSTSLANFMYFYFSIISDKARLVQNASGSDIFEQLLRIDEGDVLVAISFPRYSRRTVDAMHFARDAGAFSVAITDCEQSPIARLADRVLYAHNEMASFVDSLVAPLSLINALVSAVGQKRQREVSNTYSRLEGIWEKYNIYDKDK